jgi:hypothetical protein
MNPKLRPGTREDAIACGLIDFEAFKLISSQHNFPWDFPSIEIATGVVTMMLSNPGFYSVIAEMDGRVVGSNFLDERNSIAGIGPISVDPAVQNQTVGRQLMLAPITIVLCVYTRSWASRPESRFRKWTALRSTSRSLAMMCDQRSNPTYRRAITSVCGCTAMIAAGSSAMR